MDTKELDLEVGKRYLLGQKTYGICEDRSTILEIRVLEISETAVKYKNIITNSIRWGIKEHMYNEWVILEELKGVKIPETPTTSPCTCTFTYIPMHYSTIFYGITAG